MASSSGSSRASSRAPSRRKSPQGAKSVSAGTSKGRDDDTPTRPQQVSFLTVAEVAELMRVSKMTVYRLVHAGDLSAVRVGRSFRVPEEAVHAYLRDAYIEAG